MTKQKKIFFFVVSVFLVYGLIEILCFAALRLAGCENSKRGVVCQNSQADSNIVLPPWMTSNVGQFIIHPYLGFVYNPDNLEITRFGFLDNKHPIQKKTVDKIIVGIFGGSSAEIFGQFGAETLINDLIKDSAFKDKQIIVLNLAIGSYKQPQQLMVLNYLLALGGEFDFVINLDGFNEIVLPVLWNIPNWVNPFFPRRWDLKVVDSAILTPQIVILADILKLKQKNLRQNNLVHCGILRFSSTARLLSYYLDRNLNSRIIAKTTQLFEQQNEQIRDRNSVLGHGPDFKYDNEQTLYQDLTDVWARSSQQMHDLCAANKIKYLHFIQPNQYLPDSKVMSESELKIAFDPNAEQRQIVIKGYPFLQQQARRLKKQGLAVYDLSLIFQNYSQSLYIDTFCHFGQEGCQIIAHDIAKAMLKEYKN